MSRNCQNSKGRIGSPGREMHVKPGVDERIRYVEVYACAEGKYRCGTCNRKFPPRMTTRGPVAWMIMLNRNGLSFDVGGYRCAQCMAALKGGDAAGTQIAFEELLGVSETTAENARQKRKGNIE